MTVGALNSGAINAVPFPQAEAGLSLVQLLGTIEVSGSIPALYTRRTVGASTTACANGAAGITFRLQADATAVAQAKCSAHNRTKVRNNVATTEVTATTAAEVLVKHRLSAIQPVRATVACAAVIKVARAASTQARATVATVAAKTRVPRTAATPARATPSAIAFVKVRRQATTPAKGLSTAHIKLVHRLSATTFVRGLGTAVSTNEIWLGATALAKATTQANALRKRRLGAVTAPSAITQVGLAGVRYKLAAQTIGEADGSAQIILAHQVSATTTAEAITRSAATDYGIAMPAPAERLMFVSASERSMEVTE